MFKKNVDLQLHFFHIDKEYERSCHKVIEEQLSVHIARINFVGLQCSGKSVTLQRLVGKMLNLMDANLLTQLPTGVVEDNKVFMMRIKKNFGFISKNQWSNTDLDLVGETAVLKGELNF